MSINYKKKYLKYKEKYLSLRKHAIEQKGGEFCYYFCWLHDFECCKVKKLEQQLEQVEQVKLERQQRRQLEQLEPLLEKYRAIIKASISIDNTINVTVLDELQSKLQSKLYDILSTHFKKENEFESLGDLRSFIITPKYTKNGLNGIAYDNIIVEKIKEIENKKIENKKIKLQLMLV